MTQVYRLLLAIWTLHLWVGAAGAAQCQRANVVCVDASPTKVVSGVTISISQTAYGCWDFEQTFDCVEPNNVDYCAAIASTPGCSQTASTCTTQAFNGDCTLYTNTYQCGNAVSYGAGVIELAQSYTVVFDQYDYSPCASLASNPSCQLAKTTCTDTTPTKNINGMNVSEPCWQETRDYSCLVNTNINYCQALDSNGCKVQSSTCTNTGLNGICTEKSFQYICANSPGATPSNITYLNTTYTIIKDTTDTSQCQNLATNPNCSLASHTCVEGAGTRVINGLPIYKSCWKWQDDYSCSGFVQTSTCDPLKNDPNCSQVKSTCIDFLPNGQCGHTEYQYRCVTGAGVSTTQANCSNQSFCVDGSCYDTSHPNDTDFANAVVAQEIARQAGDYGIFQGEIHNCTKNPVKSCCMSNSGGGGANNASLAMQAGVTTLKAGAEVVKVWGSQYVYDSLMNTGSEVLQNMAINSLGASSTFASGSASFWGCQMTYQSGTGFTFAFDPASLYLQVALLVYQYLSTCTPQEQTLGMLRGRGLCVQVQPSYCKTKVLGTCTVSAEGWCCFPSKLGRIIQEQGRAQIGKSWGTGQNPDCTGFTVTELGQLDFDKMDFSEFIADIVASAKNAAYATQRVANRSQNYFSNGSGPNIGSSPP